jgi:hypothetical protein
MSMNPSFPDVPGDRHVTLRARVAMWAVAIFASAAALGAEAGDIERSAPDASSLAAAGAAPIRAVRVFRVYGWSRLDASAGVIWLGVDEPYVIRFGADCPQRDDVAPSAVALKGTHLVPGRDRVVFSAGSCLIDGLARADRNKLRADSINPGSAHSVRLIQDGAPRRSR